MISHFQHEECKPGVIFKLVNNWEGKGVNQAKSLKAPAVPGVNPSVVTPWGQARWTERGVPKGLRAQLIASQ